MLNTYIWTKEDLIKSSVMLLDQGWPFEPMRLLGIKMSMLKTQADIKKDKTLNEYFGAKISSEEFRDQNLRVLQKVKLEAEKEKSINPQK